MLTDSLLKFQQMCVILEISYRIFGEIVLSQEIKNTNIERQRFYHCQKGFIYIGLYLTILDLSENNINIMELNIFLSDSFRFLFANLSGNNLSVVDATNFIVDYPYCQIDYSNNLLYEITNQRNLVLEEHVYGEGGYVNLNLTNSSSLLTLKKQGFLIFARQDCCMDLVST